MESLTVVERSAKFNNVAYLTEGLRSCVVEQCKPSVKHVTMLNSADSPHGIADTGSSLRNSTGVTDFTEGLRSRNVEL